MLDTDARLTATISSLAGLTKEPCGMRHHRVWELPNGVEAPVCAAHIREGSSFCAHADQLVHKAALKLLQDLNLLSDSECKLLNESILWARELLWSADLAAIEAGKLLQDENTTKADAVTNKSQRISLMNDLGITEFVGDSLSSGLMEHQKIAASGLVFIADVCLRVLRNHVAGKNDENTSLIQQALRVAAQVNPRIRNFEFVSFPPLPKDS